MQTRAEILRSTTRPLHFTTPHPSNHKLKKHQSLWTKICTISTFYIPNFILSFFGIKTANVQEAWREKVTLCLIIFLSCLGLAFMTYGINTFMCTSSENLVYGKLMSKKSDKTLIITKGKVFSVSKNNKQYKMLRRFSTRHKLINLTAWFKSRSSACMMCFNHQVIQNMSNSFFTRKSLKTVGDCYFTWSDIIQNGFIVIDGNVYDPAYNIEPYYIEFINAAKQSDGTKLFNEMPEQQRKCFMETFYAGKLFVKSYGCLIADFMLYLTTVTIFGLIIVRFVLAILYSWYIKSKTRKNNIYPCHSFCILLVTCYSEDHNGLKSTLDSLALQDHEEKVIFVICDGLILGEGNALTTPEIVLSLMEIEYESEPVEYNAISSGSKQYNRAKVYSGTYYVDEIGVKIIVVNKVGAENEPSRGNRGKRDSQVILLGFFSRLLYRDRMSPLDFEIYRVMRNTIEVDPTLCEYILMVDADTIVDPTAVSYFARTFDADDKIMGMTGETKIANKCESWVTMIQVFEYYIAHYLGKSFESVFGGVTCLPGCFCMYRIQEFKTLNGKCESTPIVVNPFIINAYSVTEASTLHQKNLLLLGEDRYLTNLLLKTFYRHKLAFLPAAKCETQVPASFKVLLSQRRRWINSTVHNLFELVLVDKLCGTFCCSMQFVIFLELFGTLILPAAILFTFVLVVAAVMGSPAWLPIIMLLGILGLPGVLIFFTTFEVAYLFWLFVYILSLPVWNFVLPTYAFWHFDDFSWGETRKIEAVETKNGINGIKDHVVESEKSEMKKVKMRNFEEVYPNEELNVIVK